MSDKELHEAHPPGAGSRLVDRLDSLVKLNRAAAEMSAVLARYKTLFDHANDAVYVHGFREDGSPDTFIEVNRAATEMLGYPQEELLRMAPKDIDSGLDSARLAEIRSILATNGRAVFNMAHQAKDGRKIPVEVSAHIFVMDGSRTMLAIVRDVSERVKWEKELVEARKDAEAASQAKSEFLANLSHEIRTPLNGVLGMLQLLKTTDLSDEQSEYAATALRTGEGLLALMEDILDMAELQAGRVRTATAAFDPAALIRETTALLEPQAKAKGLGLAIRLGPLPQHVLGDQARLRQVLFNLTANAIKFTEQGEIRIKGEIEPATRNNGRALAIEVADTGPGIPEDQMAMLQEPFTQADASLARKHGGTGLGLSVAKRLVHLMNGTLTLANHPQGGLIARTLVPLPDQP